MTEPSETPRTLADCHTPEEYADYYCNVVDDLSEIAVENLTVVIRDAMEQGYHRCVQIAEESTGITHGAADMLAARNPYSVFSLPTQQLSE